MKDDGRSTECASSKSADLGLGCLAFYSNCVIVQRQRAFKHELSVIVKICS